MNPDELESYLKAGKIAKDAINFGIKIIKEGEKAEDIADSIEEFIKKNGGELAFPVNLSSNDEAAHYSPERNDNRIISKNDIIKLDLGVHINGYIADTAVTIEVGKNENSPLTRASESALNNVVNTLRPGIKINEIGRIIENSILSFGYRPIYNLTGHQLKKYILHAGLSIPNYDDGDTRTLDVGMAFAIEPFATSGVGFVKEGKFGNIVEIMKEDNENSILYEKYRGLPFCTRWVYKDFNSPEKLLDIIKYNRNIYKFPILKEKKKGLVSQFEHTFVITPERVYVTTMR